MIECTLLYRKKIRTDNRKYVCVYIRVITSQESVESLISISDTIVFLCLRSINLLSLDQIHCKLSLSPPSPLYCIKSMFFNGDGKYVSTSVIC